MNGNPRILESGKGRIYVATATYDDRIGVLIQPVEAPGEVGAVPTQDVVAGANLDDSILLLCSTRAGVDVLMEALMAVRVALPE